MNFLATRCMLADTACTLLILIAPNSANAFGGHLIGSGRQPTTAYFVLQPMVPAPAAPTVAYVPVMAVPAAPVTAYYPPAFAAPAPVTTYYAPAAPVAAPGLMK